MQDRLRLVDMVLEVRDARIPFSSANPELEKLVRHKRRILVLNKADLAAPEKQQVSYTNLLLMQECIVSSAHVCLMLFSVTTCVQTPEPSTKTDAYMYCCRLYWTDYRSKQYQPCSQAVKSAAALTSYCKV